MGDPKSSDPLVVPINTPHSARILILCRKDAEGHVERDGLLPVSFVPMVRRDR